MKETEAKNLDVDSQKRKIRERYKGVDSASLTVIPAKPRENIFSTDTPKRVAVYARVSTDDPNQTSSYELQRNYYEDMVLHHNNWTLVNIYADEGISGTSLSHRDSFKEMIKDCEADKIDLIITKNVARFARNIEDCIHYTRKLKNRKNPIGILFENERIYTLNPDSEMQLSFIATMAQEESRTKSVAMNGSYEMRFKRGIFMTPVLLGYDHDEDGNLVINKEEARTVRLIFLLYMSGRNCSSIADILTRLKRVTKKGNEVWSAGSIYGILKNERYCGDVLAHKTFTPDFLTHKSVKNENDRPQYYQEDHHEAIISRSDFLTVQKLMDYNKYGYRNMLPELKEIDQGVLKGFVQINPCWMGFTEVDYLNACHSVLEDSDYLEPTILIKRNKGDFDYSGYEVVREQFSTGGDRITVTFNPEDVAFNQEAIKALDKELYVELLYHPIFQMLVVRKSEKSNPHAIAWAAVKGDDIKPRRFKGTSFLDILYDLCQWNKSFNYRLTGILKEKDREKLLMFYADEPEIRISKSQLQYLKDTAITKEQKGFVTAFPRDWMQGFGLEYNEYIARSVSIFGENIKWEIGAKGVVAEKSELDMRSQCDIEKELNALIREMEESYEH